jgi:hypothetical protein
MREFDPFRRELVQVRRQHLRVRETAQVPVAEVIAQEDNDVGLLRGVGRTSQKGKTPRHDKVLERQSELETVDHGASAHDAASTKEFWAELTGNIVGDPLSAVLCPIQRTRRNG